MTETPETPLIPDEVTHDGDLIGVHQFIEAETPLLPPPEQAFQTIEHTWIGTDGSEWDLSNPDSGVFLVQESIEGLHHPPMDLIRRQSPTLPGSSFHGYRVAERPVVWPLYIYSDESSMHWVERDRALWNALKPGREGTWRVTLPNGDYRQLRMRVEPSPQAFERDPVRFGWHKYAIQAVADINPFWTTPTEVGTRVSWKAAEGDDFFNDGQAPPFNVSESSIETVKSYFNPGDEDVWPIIRITGQMNKVDFVIGGQSFTVNCNLAHEGETFTINTDPRFFEVTDNQGRNRVRDVTTWSFRPIPPGKTTKISAIPDSDGGGSVMLDVSPLYYRAW